MSSVNTTVYKIRSGHGSYSLGWCRKCQQVAWGSRGKTWRTLAAVRKHLNRFDPDSHIYPYMSAVVVPFHLVRGRKIPVYKVEGL